MESLQKIILKATDKLSKNWTTQKNTIVKSLIPIHTAHGL
jgi:ribosomal protein L33